MQAPPEASPKPGRGMMALGLGLGAVLVGSGGMILGVGGLLWWQYYRVTAPTSAGLLTVINERAGVVDVACTGDGGAETAAQVPASGTGMVAVPPRPATCVGTAQGGESPVVLRWEAQDPPALGETWTVRIPALVPVATTTTVVEEPAPPPVPVAEGPYTLQLQSARTDLLHVKCEDVGAGTPPTLVDLEPQGSAAVVVGRASRCVGTTRDGTLVWAWEYAAPSEGTEIRVTVPGSPREQLAGAPATPVASAAPATGSPKSARTRPAEPPAAEAPAPPAAASSGVMTLVKIDVRRAGKLKGATVTIDGAAVGYPGMKSVGMGIHSLKAYKEGVIDLSCTLAASGDDILVTLDPDKPVCP